MEFDGSHLVNGRIPVSLWPTGRLWTGSVRHAFVPDSFVVIERLLGPRPTHSCMTNKEGPCGTCKRRHTAQPRGSKGIACRETE